MTSPVGPLDTVRFSINTDELEFLDNAKVLAVGGYQLVDAATQAKQGLLSFHSLADSSHVPPALSQIAFEHGGVFQLKSDESRQLLWVALSDGTLRAAPTAQLLLPSASESLFSSISPSFASTNLSTTGVDVISEDQAASAVAASCYNDGSIAVWGTTALLAETTLNNTNSTVQEPMWCVPNAHSAEAWQVCWLGPSTLLSGGDDAAWNLWDIRTSPHDAKPVISQRKFYGAGVTSFASRGDSIQFTAGSYDEQLAVWDIRSASRVPVSQVSSVGGGVWRLKSNSENRSLLFAACMHGGWRLFDTSADPISIAASFAWKCHNLPSALAYGACWINRQLVAGCSFYDNTVSIWNAV